MFKYVTYLLESSAIAVGIFLISRKMPAVQDFIVFVLGIFATLIVLDYFAPKISDGARQGMGFGLGGQMIGGKHPHSHGIGNQGMAIENSHGFIVDDHRRDPNDIVDVEQGCANLGAPGNKVSDELDLTANQAVRYDNKVIKTYFEQDKIPTPESLAQVDTLERSIDGMDATNYPDMDLKE